MTGYSLFVRIFGQIYNKYQEDIRKLDALGHTFLHYAAYLWNRLGPVQQARWNGFSILQNYNEESLRAELINLI